MTGVVANTAVKDLVVLAADSNMEFAVRGILSRAPSLQIRSATFDVLVHPEHDPGCLRRGAALLSPLTAQYRHALVMFDLEGCGQEAQGREELERGVEEELAVHWTAERCAVVVIEPELENWVWSDSPHVETYLGWEQGTLFAKLRAGGVLVAGSSKPARPKESMEWALRERRKQRSSKTYERIAGAVSLSRCIDPSFLKLKGTLQRWFAA